MLLLQLQIQTMTTTGFNLTMRRTAFQDKAAWVGEYGGDGGGSGVVSGSSLCCHTTLGCAVSARRWPVMRPTEAGTGPARPLASSHACNTHQQVSVSGWLVTFYYKF